MTSRKSSEIIIGWTGEKVEKMKPIFGVVESNVGCAWTKFHIEIKKNTYKKFDTLNGVRPFNLEKIVQTWYKADNITQY